MARDKKKERRQKQIISDATLQNGNKGAIKATKLYGTSQNPMGR